MAEVYPAGQAVHALPEADSLPLGHFKHMALSRPREDGYSVLAVHGVHDPSAGNAHSWLPQAKQASAEPAALLAEKVPAGQSLQAVCPVEAHLPGPHGMGGANGIGHW
jgi:hypothetical protein